MLLHISVIISEAFAFGNVGNSDKKLTIHLYQVGLFSKWLQETMKNSYGVDKYIKLSRGLTDFSELLLHTTLSMDLNNGIAQLLITDYT